MILAAFAVLSLIWGTTWAAIQIGLQGVPPFTGVSIRFAIAAALLLVLAVARGVRLGRNRREIGLWLVNGLFSFSVSYGVVYWAEQWVPSGLAAVLFATYPLFVAMLAHVALPAEPLTLHEVLGILIGFGGVAVIFSQDFAALGGAQVAVAAAVMLISPISAAIGSVAVKRWAKGIHPFSLTAMPMALTAGVMGAMAVLFERDREVTWDLASVGAMVYLSVIGSALTFTLYFWLLSHLPAKRIALIAYITPLVAIAIGAMRGEPLTARVLAGSVLVVGGVALAVQKRRAE